jgi:hypothetical protein
LFLKCHDRFRIVPHREEARKISPENLRAAPNNFSHYGKKSSALRGLPERATEAIRSNTVSPFDIPLQAIQSVKGDAFPVSALG